MKVVCELPDEIVRLWRENPSVGRNTIQSKFGCGDKEARFYSKLLKAGNLIHTEHVKTRPSSGEVKKALILPDIHAPYHNQKALDSAINYGLKVGVDVVIIGGDGSDCYAISAWRTDPQRPIYKVEVDQTIPVFQSISDAFYDKEKKYLEGNHELRLRSLLWSGAKQLAGLRALTIPRIYELDEMGWQYISNVELMQNDMQPFRLGKLFVLHGHEIKMSWGAVNFARLYYLKTHCNVLAFHHHQTHEYIAAKLDLSIEGAWTGGCLCRLHPEYAPSNSWNHGFAVVTWDSDGDFSVENKKIICGKVL